MTVLIFATTIGIVLGLRGQPLSLVFGGLLVVATTMTALLVLDPSAPFMVGVGISILGYNLGLALSFVMLFKLDTAK